MNTKPLLLSLANAVLYLVTCALIGTGLLLELRMDAEDGPIKLFDMGRDDWGEIHFAIAIGFGVLALIHLVLHWAWIKVLYSKSKWTISVLIAGLIMVAGLLLWPPTYVNASMGEHIRNFLKERD